LVALLSREVTSFLALRGIVIQVKIQLDRTLHRKRQWFGFEACKHLTPFKIKVLGRLMLKSGSVFAAKGNNIARREAQLQLDQ